MSIYNVLNWQNENALSSYPLSSDIFVQDLVVDAKFIQFDNFRPTLVSVFVEFDLLTLNLTHDTGSISVVFLKATYDSAETARYVTMYTSDGSRFLGTLTIGPGAVTLWQNYVGQLITVNTTFLLETVRSVPSNSGVYKLDGSYGVVTLQKSSDDKTVFFNMSSTLNSITFNAVTGNSATGGPQGVRKINLVPPLNNNITLATNDVIKVSTFNSSSITLDLVSGNASQAFSVSTLSS